MNTLKNVTQSKLKTFRNIFNKVHLKSFLNVVFAFTLFFNQLSASFVNKYFVKPVSTNG
jgi:hypothetical protein